MSEQVQVMEGLWRGLVLAWSLSSAAGASMTFIMLRAARRDQTNIPTDQHEVGLLGRRVIRGVGSRLIALTSFLLAAGTLWVVPEPARNVAHLAVRMGFVVAFCSASFALLWLSLRDLLDTLDLLKQKPLDPDAPVPGREVIR